MGLILRKQPSRRFNNRLFKEVACLLVESQQRFDFLAQTLSLPHLL